MPFPLQNPDGCVDSGLVCPLNKGTTYEYVATLPVLKAYPKVNLKHSNNSSTRVKMAFALVYDIQLAFFVLHFKHAGAILYLIILLF